MHSRDTSPEARRIVLEALRRATPAERLEMAMQQTELLWKLVWAGVVQELPHGSENDRRARFMERWLGRRVAASLPSRLTISRASDADAGPAS